MPNIIDILARALSLRQETELNSITPNRAGGIMYDTLLVLNQMQLEGGALLISKVYASVAAMEADTTPTSDLTGRALKPGQLVVIVPSDPSSADLGSIYRYNGPGSWTYTGKTGGLPMDNVPIQGSEKGITSGAVYTMGKAIEATTVNVDSQQSLTDAQKQQGRANIGAASEEEVSQLSAIQLTLYAYTTGDTLPTQKYTSGNYYSALFKAYLGTQIVVSGLGGAEFRLWATYNSQKQLVRKAEANVDTTASPITLTLSNDECYVVVNTRTTVLDSSYVRIKNIGDFIVKLIDDLDEQVADQNTKNAQIKSMMGTYSCTVSSANAAKTVSPVYAPNYELTDYGVFRVRFKYKNTATEGVTLKIGNADAKPLYYNGSAVFNTNTWENEETVFVYYDGTNYQAWSIARINDLTTGGSKALTAEQGKILKGILDEHGTNLDTINTDLYNLTNLTDTVSWTNNKYIKADHSIVTTGATNKVGVMAIPSGFDVIKFNFSIKSGGGSSFGNKLGWFITDSNGNVVTKSAEYAYNVTMLDTAVVPIPKGATYLTISWNTDLTAPQSVTVMMSPAALYNRVNELEDSIDRIVQIENTKAQAYLKTRYNNGDYGYTKFPYSSGSVSSNNVDITLPNGAVIDTPVDSSAETRTLEYADNPGFSGNKVVGLDLVSTQYTIQDLEGDKFYYWRVYKDSTVTSLLASGSFRTDGHLRQIRIPADSSNFDMTYIPNIRDIGGWQTEGGKRIRYGVLFRGHELNHNNEGTLVSYISQDGIDAFTALGVNAELDLRGGNYNVSALPDADYANFAADLLFFRLNIYNTIKSKTIVFVNAIRQVVTWIKAGKGIYAHCQGGCDRTGFLCAAIEGICGVSENDINLDYELSIRNRNREYYTIAGGDDYDGDFKFAMEYIKGLLEYNNHIYVYYRGNYYDAEATVSNYTPVAIIDASLLAALGALSFGTLKQRFHRLMKVGGMTEREMEELEMLMCS